MAKPSEPIVVKSHVARDLLQTAGLFKNERLVVWEYVVNGLEYVDSGTSPVVKVVLDASHKRITIVDNGRGMDWTGLTNFFIMHGENIDRKAGRPGRGRFGTGKSAAFGIADVLRITTVCNGNRCRVELSHADVEAVSSGEEIPVRVLERNVPTEVASGTVVEINGIHLRSLDQAGIIQFVEKHLAKWPRNVTVFINNHECELTEPPVSFERRFKPDQALKDSLGDIELVIKVSKSPLDVDFRGISIFSRGVLHETTLAGSEGREMSQYIFGEVDVAKLDEDDSSPTPFDLSRSMQLNRSNELVRLTFAFLNQKIEEIRRELVEGEKQRRATEEAKKLARHAAEIAKIINDDFATFRNQVAKAKARADGGTDIYRSQPPGGSETTELLFGDQVPAEVTSPIGDPGADGGSGGTGSEPRNLKPQVQSAGPESERKGRPAGGVGTATKPRGGFQVAFAHQGIESPRAKYQRDERTIYVNLDHPQLAAAMGQGREDDPVFRRLACEVAFCEYAVALATELALVEGYYQNAIDLVVDLRETINRIARKSAQLYSV